MSDERERQPRDGENPPADRPLYLWERQLNGKYPDGVPNIEPSRYWIVFDIYRLQGPFRRSLRRALDEAFALYGSKTGKSVGEIQPWRNVFHQWSWQQRAEAWDAYEAKQRGAADADVRAAARVKRLKLYQDALDTLQARLDDMDIDDLRPAETFNAIAKLGAEQRVELDDTPGDHERRRLEEPGVGAAMPRAEDKMKHEKTS